MSGEPEAGQVLRAWDTAGAGDRTGTGWLERPADAAWPQLVRGQRVTITRDGEARTYTVTAVRPGGYGSEAYDLEPLEVRQCRYCGEDVILGKRGWRTDTVDAAGYVCEDAPRGFHGTDHPAITP